MRGLVSLIMPVQVEDYFEEAVLSICNQSYSDWELIIVACQSEYIQQVINRINSSRIKYVVTPETHGLVQAFAIGFSYSSGEFIIRHDADDVSLGDRIMKQATYLNEHPEADMVSCLIRSFSEEWSSPDPSENMDQHYNFHTTPDSIDQAVLHGFIPVIFPSLMIRRSLLNRANLYRSKTNFDDHMELFLNLLRISETAKIEEILYLYRRHNKAYHLIHKMDYIKHLKFLLDDDMKQCIRYRSFNNEVSALPAVQPTIHIKNHLHVLILIDTLGIGGTENYVLNLAWNLTKRGIYVVIAGSGGVFEAVLSKFDIKFYRITFHGIQDGTSSKASILSDLKEIMDSECIDVVHCNLHISADLAKNLHTLYGIPYVVTLHGMFYTANELAATCSDAEAVIAVSKPVYGLFMRYMGYAYKGMVKLIYNSVDAEIFRPVQSHQAVRESLKIGKDDLLIVYCSRLGFSKGRAAEVFIKWFEQLCKKHPRLYGIIIGDGEKKGIIAQQAYSCNCSLNRKALYVIGSRYDVCSFYLESDLVVGTGRVILEAMCCGKPVVASGSNGFIGMVSPVNREIMLETYFGDHAGLNEANSANPLQCIDMLLSSSAMRQQLGEFSRNWCLEIFNSENTITQIIDIYTRIIENN